MKNPRLSVRILLLCLCSLILLAGEKQIRSLETKLSHMQRSLDQKEREIENWKGEASSLSLQVSQLTAVTAVKEEKEEREQVVKSEIGPLEVYYLREVNGKVVVYQQDGQTIFQPTDILVSNLPTYLQNEIYRGKYMKSSQELYNFLENYSS